MLPHSGDKVFLLFQENGVPEDWNRQGLAISIMITNRIHKGERLNTSIKNPLGSVLSLLRKYEGV